MNDGATMSSFLLAGESSLVAMALLVAMVLVAMTLPLDPVRRSDLQLGPDSESGQNGSHV